MVQIEMYESDLGVNQGLKEFNEIYKGKRATILDYVADYTNRLLQVTVAIDDTNKGDE